MFGIRLDMVLGELLTGLIGGEPGVAHPAHSPHPDRTIVGESAQYESDDETHPFEAVLAALLDFGFEPSSADSPELVGEEPEGLVLSTSKGEALSSASPWETTTTGTDRSEQTIGPDATALRDPDLTRSTPPSLAESPQMTGARAWEMIPQPGKSLPERDQLIEVRSTDGWEFSEEGTKLSAEPGARRLGQHRLLVTYPGSVPIEEGLEEGLEEGAIPDSVSLEIELGRQGMVSTELGSRLVDLLSRLRRIHRTDQIGLELEFTPEPEEEGVSPEVEEDVLTGRLELLTDEPEDGEVHLGRPGSPIAGDLEGAEGAARPDRGGQEWGQVTDSANERFEPGGQPLGERAETTRSDFSTRVAEIAELREELAARPNSRVILRVEGEDGVDTRIRLDLRGARVDAEIRPNDHLAAQRLSLRLEELAHALERHGLESGRVMVEGLRESALMNGYHDRGMTDGGRGNERYNGPEDWDDEGRRMDFDQERSDQEQKGEERR